MRLVRTPVIAHVMQPDAVQVRWWLHQSLVLVAGALFMLHYAWRSRTGGMGERTLWVG